MSTAASKKDGDDMRRPKTKDLKNKLALGTTNWILVKVWFPKYVQTDPHRFGLSSSGPPRFPTSTETFRF